MPMFKAIYSIKLGNNRLYANASVLLGLTFLSVVIISATVVASFKPMDVDSIQTVQGNQNQTAFTIQTAADLDQLYRDLNYVWPPQKFSDVPHITLQQLPTDFASIQDSTERKNLFLRTLLPIVLLENRRIQEQRNLLALLFSQALPAEDSPMGLWLSSMRKELRIRGDIHKAEIQQRMLQRLDEIPPVLALAQAAIESGWGTSRFALEGNSLFGQWTFQSKRGLEPSKRDPDATHFVASFPNLQASVRAYMRNLNTGRAYGEFRLSRAALRTQNKPLNAYMLADHLHRYSQRGVEYVKDLRIIIAGRSLEPLHTTPLVTNQKRIAAIQPNTPEKDAANS